MMLALGLFTFGLSTLAYQDFQRQTDFKHARLARVGARDANQFTGPGADTLTLRGLLAPEFDGDPESLDTLREMAAKGDTYPLVDGTGRVHGAWVIDGIEEGQTLFHADGRARRIEFTVKLHQVDG